MGNKTESEKTNDQNIAKNLINEELAMNGQKFTRKKIYQVIKEKLKIYHEIFYSERYLGELANG